MLFFFVFLSLREEGGKGGFSTHQALGDPKMTRHLQPWNTHTHAAGNESQLATRGPWEEERMLQAPLGPHPISILSSPPRH